MSRKEQIKRAAQGNYPDDAILRNAFEISAKWADITMIDRACEWLKENYWKICNCNLISCEKELDIRGLDDFRKAMRE